MTQQKKQLHKLIVTFRPETPESLPMTRAMILKALSAWSIRTRFSQLNQDLYEITSAYDNEQHAEEARNRVLALKSRALNLQVDQFLCIQVTTTCQKVG